VIGLSCDAAVTRRHRTNGAGVVRDDVRGRSEALEAVGLKSRGHAPFVDDHRPAAGRRGREFDLVRDATERGLTPVSLVSPVRSENRSELQSGRSSTAADGRVVSVVSDRSTGWDARLSAFV
jgi:hypothetical protein